MELVQRPRRLRTTPVLRKMVRETRMDPSSLIYPMFVKEGITGKNEIPSMPGQYHYGLDMLPKALEEVRDAGVSSVMLFGIPKTKDDWGSGAWAADGIIQQALELAKKEMPSLFYISDTCMCEYTSHGHCGIIENNQVDNDKTLDSLARIAVSQAQAGADMVAPSDMMDGRILAVRSKLDKKGFTTTPILAYSAKYASSFYEPFREAAQSAPQFGDRKNYQMDYHNKREALRELELDEEEGADILMIKPALSYLDVISEARKNTNHLLAAYSVSGEYAMIKAAAKAGFIKEDHLICETAVSIYRAGADLVVSYYAKEIAKFMKEGRIG
ncbi:MAG: porphobilinogen synthase [bacterium]|nr:porphobilinogen synthase [bacterium]